MLPFTVLHLEDLVIHAYLGEQISSDAKVYCYVFRGHAESIVSVTSSKPAGKTPDGEYKWSFFVGLVRET